MTKHRIQGQIDGTQLLERLSADALQTYLGRSRARSMVFGTAIAGGFKAKIDNLCRELSEGGGFQHIDPGPVTAKDGKLDSVAWLPFMDNLPGKVILFCQCKTGSSWESQITQLRPDDFGRKFTNRSFLVTPQRVFCLSEAIAPIDWNSTTVDGGILLDRCRLVSLCNEVKTDTLADIFAWTERAMIHGLIPAGSLAPQL